MPLEPWAFNKFLPKPRSTRGSICRQQKCNRTWGKLGQPRFKRCIVRSKVTSLTLSLSLNTCLTQRRNIFIMYTIVAASTIEYLIFSTAQSTSAVHRFLPNQMILCRKRWGNTDVPVSRLWRNSTPSGEPIRQKVARFGDHILQILSGREDLQKEVIYGKELRIDKGYNRRRLYMERALNRENCTQELYMGNVIYRKGLRIRQSSLKGELRIGSSTHTKGLVTAFAGAES